MLRLLRAGVDLVPELAEYDLVEAVAGLRPGTPDNAPILGPLPGRPDVLVATGHHRHGIVLTPVTADLVADLVTTGAPDPLLDPFRPDRFAGPGHRPTGAADARGPAVRVRRIADRRPASADGSGPDADGGGPVELMVNGAARSVPGGASVADLVRDVTAAAARAWRSR